MWFASWESGAGCDLKTSVNTGPLHFWTAGLTIWNFEYHDQPPNNRYHYDFWPDELWQPGMKYGVLADEIAAQPDAPAQGAHETWALELLGWTRSFISRWLRPHYVLDVQSSDNVIVTSYADRKNLYFKPTIVGLHGDQGVTVDKKDLNYWESLQAAVYPASLFEVLYIGACSHHACNVAPR
jgi:hypothetical protein